MRIPAVIARLQPLATVGYRWATEPLAARWRRIGLAIFMVLFALLYLDLAGTLITTTNQEPAAQDQQHNMTLAVRLRAERENPGTPGWKQLPYYTDGVVAPFWPWLTSYFPGAAREAPTPSFFTAGKRFNTAITLGFLILLGAFCIRRFTLLGTVCALLLITLGALLPRAVYFQPEPLYYLLFFGAWVSGLHALQAQRLWPYLTLGTCAGLAYLTKTSITPLLLAFTALSGLRLLLDFFWPGGGAANPSPRLHGIGIASVLGIFFLIAAPRLIFSEQTYGSPFHSYPKYWMWMDDFDETGFAWMVAHPREAELEAIPEDELPSLSTYLDQHSGADLWKRLSGGVSASLKTVLRPTPRRQPRKGEPKPWLHLLPKRGWHLAILGSLVLGLAGASWIQRRRSPIQRDNLFPVLFVATCAVGYTLAYGWYHPIGRGERFMLSLFLPLTFSLVWAAESLLRQLSGLRWPRLVYRAVLGLMLFLMLTRVQDLLAHPVFREGVR